MSLQRVHEFSFWSGLHLNVSKCDCLSMINSSSRGRYIESFSPAYGTDSIPALKWEDTYRFLGVEIGRPRKDTVDPVMANVVETVERIVKSKLTDWQKVDAFNTFAVSKLMYHLNSTCLNRSWVAKLDATTRRQVKKAVKLPVRTTSSFLYYRVTVGGWVCAWWKVDWSLQWSPEVSSTWFPRTGLFLTWPGITWKPPSPKEQAASLEMSRKCSPSFTHPLQRESTSKVTFAPCGRWSGNPSSTSAAPSLTSRESTTSALQTTHPRRAS